MESLLEFENYALQNGLNVIVTNPGETIFAEGDPAKGLYYVIDNYVKILKPDELVYPTLLWYAKSRELFGLKSFFHGDKKYTYSAVTGEQPCNLIFISNEKFSALLKQYPVLEQKLLKMLCDRINFIEMRTKNILFQSIDERIIETLLFLTSKENDGQLTGGQKNLRINYTKRQLAEMVGTSIEYLRRRIKELKSHELIDYGRNWLSIRDMDRLKVLMKE